MFHDLAIKGHPGRYKVYLNGEEISGVRSADIHYGVDELPELILNIYPGESNLEGLRRIGVEIEAESVREAIKCLQFTMKLDDDFRHGVIASTKSVIDEIRDKNQTDVINDYDLARAIVDRIFSGEIFE